MIVHLHLVYWVAKMAFRWLLCLEGYYKKISPSTHSEHVFKFHPYEGHALSAVVFPVRVMAKLGIKDLISESDFIFILSSTSTTLICLVTNASGSLNPNIPVGTSMLHLSSPFDKQFTKHTFF